MHVPPHLGEQFRLLTHTEITISENGEMSTVVLGMYPTLDLLCDTAVGVVAHLGQPSARDEIINVQM